MPAKKFKVVNIVKSSINESDGGASSWQCTCMSLLSILYSKFKRVSLWSKNDLDLILVLGDKLYKDNITSEYLSFKELPRCIALTTNISITVFSIISDFFTKNFDQSSTCFVINFHSVHSYGNVSST